MNRLLLRLTSLLRQMSAAWSLAANVPAAMVIFPETGVWPVEDDLT